MCQLIYFGKCPVGIDYKEVNRDDLDENHSLKNYSSPTLLHDEEIIFGSYAKGGGCSMKLPSADELKKLCSSL